MTMIVASGTSTPTSMTVVATSTAIVATPERLHRAILFRRAHAPMHEPHPGPENTLQGGEAVLRRGKIGFVGFLDQRTHPIGAVAFVDGVADALHHFARSV